MFATVTGTGVTGGFQMIIYYSTSLRNSALAPEITWGILWSQIHAPGKEKYKLYSTPVVQHPGFGQTHHEEQLVPSSPLQPLKFRFTAEFNPEKHSPGPLSFLSS